MHLGFRLGWAGNRRRQLGCALARRTHARAADEFAAHSGAVNCLKIGRKSSGVLVTGGDDRKVNVWAIGKPNAILVGASCEAIQRLLLKRCASCTRACGVGIGMAQAQSQVAQLYSWAAMHVIPVLTAAMCCCARPQSLSGHTSPVECVNFDGNEEVVAAGGQNGTVKLWDLNASKGEPPCCFVPRPCLGRACTWQGRCEATQTCATAGCTGSGAYRRPTIPSSLTAAVAAPQPCAR